MPAGYHDRGTGRHAGQFVPPRPPTATRPQPLGKAKVPRRWSWTAAIGLIAVAAAIATGCSPGGFGSLDQTPDPEPPPLQRWLAADRVRLTVEFETALLASHRADPITTGRAASSRRADLDTASIRLTLMLPDGDRLVFGVASAGRGLLRCEAPMIIPLTRLRTNAVSGPGPTASPTAWLLNFTTNCNGVEFPVVVAMPLDLGTATAGATLAEVTVHLALNADRGSVSYVARVTTTPTGSRLPATGPRQTGLAGQLPGLYLEQVSASIGDRFVPIGHLPQAGLDFAAPRWRFTFNQPIASLPADVTLALRELASPGWRLVDMTATGVSVVLAADRRSFEVALASPAPPLMPARRYELALRTSPFLADSRLESAVVASGTTWRFDTRAATLRRWTARDVAGRELGSWQSGQTATPTVRPGLRNLELEFDHPTGRPTMLGATFRLTHGTASEPRVLQYTNYFMAPYWSSDGRSAQVTVLAGHALTPGTLYRIDHLAGRLPDANGADLATTSIVLLAVP